MDYARVVRRAAGAVAIASLLGCSGGGSGASGGQAMISISLMDAPVDGVTAVYVKGIRQSLVTRADRLRERYVPGTTGAAPR